MTYEASSSTTATPPTSPPESGSPSPDARLARLERRLKWMLIGLIACAALAAGLGVLSIAVVRDYASHLARQRMEQAAQLRLLQQLQQDFEALDVRVPRNQIEAYGQLREQLGQLRGLYGGIERYDLTDPMGSLDALLGVKKPKPPPAATEHDDDGGAPR